MAIWHIAVTTNTLYCNNITYLTVIFLRWPWWWIQRPTSSWYVVFDCAYFQSEEFHRHIIWCVLHTCWAPYMLTYLLVVLTSSSVCKRTENNLNNFGTCSRVVFCCLHFLLLLLPFLTTAFILPFCFNLIWNPLLSVSSQQQSATMWTSQGLFRSTR